PSMLPPSVGKTIAVCWNKTAQSARAVGAAMPYLERADRIVLVSVTTHAKHGPGVGDVARTLAWHDIEAEIVEVDPDGRSVGRILLDECVKASADLMVMGGYSRNRWSEVILGGVTRYVLENAEVPIFMAH
ncbi:MAG: universal stress protein, partial [Rhodospirillaceae bacterium]